MTTCQNRLDISALNLRTNFDMRILPISIAFCLLVINLALPTNIHSWFDGLPWVSGSESIVVIVVIPTLLLLGWRFLHIPKVSMGLGVLLLFKIVLFAGAPASEWDVRVYTNQADYDNREWTPTYTTLWNKEASGILTKPWTHKFDFPTDWFLPEDLAPVKELNLVEGSYEEKFRHLKLWLTLDTVARLPKDTGLALVASGVVTGKLTAKNMQGQTLEIPIASNFEEASRQYDKLPTEGDWEILGSIHYYGENWSLIPVLVEKDGNVSTAFKKKVLWQDSSVLEKSSSSLTFFWFTAQSVDFALFCFLFIWAAWTLKQLIHEQVLTLPLVIFSVAGIGLNGVFIPLLEMVHPDPIKTANMGLATATMSIGLLLYWYWKERSIPVPANRLGHTVFLLFGPLLFFFFLQKWWPLFGRMNFWSMGNDQMPYQIFVRDMVLYDDWWRGGNDLWTGQPLHRYFIACYHIFFGQSAFVQRFVDIWCYIGAAALIASWAGKLNLSVFSSLLGSTIYLFITLAGTFRYHIGIGLQETTGMIFLILAGWAFVFWKEDSYLTIFIASFFAVIGYLVRQDHMGALAGLAFMILDPAQGSVTEVWKIYWTSFKKNSFRFMTYCSILAIGPLLVITHNGWFSGEWVLISASHPSLRNTSLIKWESLYLILTGSPWPQVPSIASLVMASGTILGLIAIIWRPKFLRRFPLSLGIILAGLLAPYPLLEIFGYAPRFSIHLLPIATLSFVIVLDSVIRQFMPDNMKIYLKPT